MLYQLSYLGIRRSNVRTVLIDKIPRPVTRVFSLFFTAAADHGEGDALGIRCMDDPGTVGHFHRAGQHLAAGLLQFRLRRVEIVDPEIEQPVRRLGVLVREDRAASLALIIAEDLVEL